MVIEMRERPDENPNDRNNKAKPQYQEAIDLEERNHKLAKQRSNNKEKF